MKRLRAVKCIFMHMLIARTSSYKQSVVSRCCCGRRRLRERPAHPAGHIAARRGARSCCTHALQSRTRCVWRHFAPTRCASTNHSQCIAVRPSMMALLVGRPSPRSATLELCGGWCRPAHYYTRGAPPSRGIRDPLCEAPTPTPHLSFTRGTVRACPLSPSRPTPPRSCGSTMRKKPKLRRRGAQRRQCCPSTAMCA